MLMKYGLFCDRSDISYEAFKFIEQVAKFSI